MRGKKHNKKIVPYRKLTARRNFGLRGIGRYIRKDDLTKTRSKSSNRNRRSSHAGTQTNGTNRSTLVLKDVQSGNGENWFESDLPVVKDMEKLSSMTSVTIDQKGEVVGREADRSPIS